MFKKILVANRGEIAVRVIRAAKEMGIKTVAIYSDVDSNSLHVKLADEAYCIGPASVSQSYLNIPSIISVAEISGAEAIHPGYGFLAENSNFAEICSSNGIKFIGPRVEAISLMGDKSKARETMMKYKVNIVPGSEGLIKNKDHALKIASKIGYPVIIKAAFGGGGRGMRIANDRQELQSYIDVAQREAENAFGNSEIYLEKYIVDPRHIEIQILADEKGNVVYFPERDCSVQRRHQKLIEESPSPQVTPKLRRKMGEAAVKVSRAIKYTSAGTVEFLVDKKSNFYFMEMNTRIQVEHPVTEMVTGIDLLKEQIRIAQGEVLSVKQKDIKINGHAMEFRVNAEDYKRNFMPSPGKIQSYLAPGGNGIRVDSHLYQGYDVPPNYDSLLAKLIVWGRNRNEVIQRSERALDEFIIDGVMTILPFHKKVIVNPYFRKGDITTDFIAKRLTPTLEMETQKVSGT